MIATEAVTAADRLRLYRTMALIRGFESTSARLLREAKLGGNLHLSLGQEAVAAGVCDVLRRSDMITTTHRGHGHCIAKGGDPARMFAEMAGRETGYGKGKAGSMHLADPSSGILGATAIVGGGLPMTIGASWSAQVRGTDDVAVAFFGEGAVAEGTFHESMNLAALWQLPVIFVCENNQYAEMLHVRMHLATSPYQLASGYGMPVAEVDGNDVEAVRAAADEAVTRARSGGGPSFLECVTYRIGGHYEGDPQRYRDAAEVEAWRARDPLAATRALLSDAEAQAIDVEIEAQLAGAVEEAFAAPVATADSIFEDVYAKADGGWAQ